MSTYPKSPKQMVGGMYYFARMLDKIRLRGKGELGPDYQSNFGAAKAADGACCAFLGVEHGPLQKRVLEGGRDEEILEWCYANGRRLREFDLMLWNEFNEKLGFRDSATPRLARLKKDLGIEDRDDIATVGDLIDYDEGRLK